MAHFKETPPSQNGWLHDLAKAEIHPEAERLLQLSRSYDPQQLVEESTIEFLAELREHFTDFARHFNAYSENSSRFQEIKVYSLAQSAADFMIFRNQVKLVISNSAHGVIQVAFAQHVRNPLSVNGQGEPLSTQPLAMSGGGTAQPQELLAQIGPFRDVFWTFQGEKITPIQVAKFYFTEFARATRDVRKSRAGNQMLIEQIKALLQEKGLDL